MISQAERMPDAPIAHYISDDDRSKRNLIYEQLGDPRVTVAGVFVAFLVCFSVHLSPGRLNYQKRIRKLVRMLSSSIGLQVVVWQECFNRWRYINDAIPLLSDTSEGFAAPSLSPNQLVGLPNKCE